MVNHINVTLMLENKLHWLLHHTNMVKLPFVKFDELYACIDQCLQVNPFIICDFMYYFYNLFMNPLSVG